MHLRRNTASQCWPESSPQSRANGHPFQPVFSWTPMAYSRYHASNTLQSRIPYELMDLQAQPRRDVIRQNPFRQLLRVEQAMRDVTGAGGVFPKRRRKQHRIHPLCKPVTRDEVPRKNVIFATADDEL